MTGKEYLSQYMYLRSAIDGKKSQASELQYAMTSLRAVQYDLDKVSGGRQRDRTLEAIIKVEEKKEEIAKDITELVSLADEIIDRINRMSDPIYMTILTKHYIGCERFERIAVDIGYAYPTVLNYHGYALQQFEECNEDIKDL